jgi:asparagine synthase (glutamine-hydrolysing)
LRAELERAVNRHLVSDVPVGTCLSGGIDSSAVACMIKSGERTKIKTFTATFPGFEKDETAHVETIVKATGMENHRTAVNAADIAADLDRFILAMEEPVPSPSPYAQYRVFELASKNGVTVLLDGQGADELFAGYHYFLGFRGRGLWKRWKIGSALRESGKGFGRQTLYFLLMPNFYREGYFRKRSNLSKALLGDEDSGYCLDYYSQMSLHSALEFHLDRKLEHLLKWEDRTSMAFSREARVPFLDADVMKLVFRLPEDFIISDGRTKSVLRDALSGIVPDSILNRTDKVGFDTPEAAWLRDASMRPLLDEFLNSEPACGAYVDVERTRALIREHLAGKDNGRAIWRTIMLERWMRLFGVN